jgi:hypothetical protein
MGDCRAAPPYYHTRKRMYAVTFDDSSLPLVRLEDAVTLMTAVAGTVSSSPENTVNIAVALSSDKDTFGGVFDCRTAHLMCT